MKSFEFTAISADGTLVQGRAPAANALELDQELEQRGLTLTRSKEAKLGRSNRKARIPRGDLIMFTTQLATTTGAGLGFVEGLTGIGQRMANPQSQTVVKEMVEGLQSGLSLSQVMDRYPNSFPEVYRSSIEAGESAGALDTVLNRLAKYMEWARGMRATTIQALIYPAILLTAIFGLILVMLYFLLPRILKMFPGGRETLPKQTQIVLAASDFLRENILVIGIGTTLVVGTLIYFLRQPIGKEVFHRLLIRMPKIGTVISKLATSRFASTANVLQMAGCDMLKVLDIAGSTCGNAAMAAAFRRIKVGVSRGFTITQGMEKESLIDPLLMQMVGVGEKTGELEQCLNRLVDYYDDEIPREVKRFLSFLEPALLLGSGLIVAFILLAALSPIFSLYENM